MSAHIPAVVMALAEQVAGVPLAWTIYPDRVVIVMEDGRKLAFEREPLNTQNTEPKQTQAGQSADAESVPAVSQPSKTKSKRKEK